MDERSDGRRTKAWQFGLWCVAAGVLASAAWLAADAGWFESPPVPITDARSREILRDVTKWDAATSEERRGAAEWVDRRTDGFALRGLRSFGFDGPRHEIPVFEHAASGLEFSLIPGGTLRMGSPDGEAGRRADYESPQHDVTIARPFLLARTECTEAAWTRVMLAAPSPSAGPLHPAQTGKHYDAAATFCRKAGLRLPSEAEWEYACRAGTTTAYWSGDAQADLARVGWFDAAVDADGRGVASGGGDHLVAQLPPNPFGLHDMHGNVSEWCSDRFHQGYVGAPTDGSAWEPEESDAVDIDGIRRVVRGGGWDGDATRARSASRDASSFRAVPRRDLGFRPAATFPLD